MHPLLMAATLAALVAVAPFAIDTYLPALPAISRDLAAPIAWVQASIPAYLIGGAIGQFFGGPVSDLMGRKPVGLAGLLLYAISSLLISQCESVQALLALRFTQALGGGCATVIVAAIVRDSRDGKDAARMMALIGLIMTSAPLVAPALGAGLLLVAGWRAIFLLLALYALLMFVLLHRQVPESRPRTRPLSVRMLVTGMARNYGAVFRQRQAVGYLLGMGFASASMFVFLSTSAFAYMEFFGVPAPQFPLLFGANILTMMIANRTGVFALRWLEPAILCRTGVTVLFVASLTLALHVNAGSPRLPVVVGLIMLGIGMMGLIYPQGMAAYLHRFPQQAGAASALLGILQFTLGAASGALANALHDGSLQPLAFGMALCATLSLTALLGLTRQRDTPSPA